MSQNTGVNPFCTIACVVEANENGVVITSPDKFILLIAVYSAKCPLLNNDIFFTFNFSHSLSSSS